MFSTTMHTHFSYFQTWKTFFKTQNCPKHGKLQPFECQTTFLALPLPATKSALSLDPLHCLIMLAHSTQTPLHPRTTHLPLTTGLFQAWKTGFQPTTDCLPASSTACYQDCISVLLISIAILVHMYKENPLLSYYHLAKVISASVYAVFILAPLDSGGSS